jgi:hypothetical protein
MAGLRVVLASGYAEMPENPGPRLPRIAKPYGQQELSRLLHEIFGDRTAQTPAAGDA